MAFRKDRVTDHSYLPGYEEFLADVLEGLSKSPKELPTKYFYDERGSELFENICALDEYYVPDVEESIVTEHISEISGLIGPKALLIELGAGSCKKIRFLLDNMDNPAAYVPIDISSEQLLAVTSDLANDYPHLELIPVCGDYTGDFEIPEASAGYDRKLVYFPGSTIGNFKPAQATQFLKVIRRICGENGALLIGVDMKKDPDVLHRAYNDSEGVTAAFNLNLLERINRELGANFDIGAFSHNAIYNPDEGRIEMHLVSLAEQSVNLNGSTISFRTGETIWTESSYKYSLEEFAEIARSAGMKMERVWTDERNWFSVQYLAPM